MTEPKVFDVLMGGKEPIPDAMHTMRFIRTRAKEIQTMNTFLSQTNCTKLIFQRLPKHMRRRTMSHNAKRLPRNVREIHLRQMEKSGLPLKQKRPSRRYRRKPKNLLAEYTRRQRAHAWLETHIWHAKRFHMVERWGYKLPESPCDKAFRACYRASAKNCLIQDLSYLCCLEIMGPQDFLMSGFKLITNPNIGLTINARAYVTGTREGVTVFYNKNTYPKQPIGEVSFIWKPNASQNRKVWLWSHPSCHNELLHVLLDIFCLEKHPKDKDNKYQNPNAGITLINLKGSLNRFRLTGPLANAVLQKSLHVPNENRCEWFTKFVASPENEVIFSEQKEFWVKLRNLTSCAELSKRIVLNLVVSDPRYNFPSKRTKALPVDAEVTDVEVTDYMKYGEIWDTKTRAEVKKNFVATSKILQERMKLIVPDNKVPADISAIPVMLVQQPGVETGSNIGYGSGWDIILPSGWALPFWLSFIMCGARSGGLREYQSVRFEENNQEIFFPDTIVGKTEEERVSQQYMDKYFRMPPNKRINYTKIGIVSPFQLRWDILMKEWTSESCEELYVLRDRKMLNHIKEVLTSKYKIPLSLPVDVLNNCLVPVKLDIIKRGRARRYAIICVPEDGDGDSDPVEPKREDPNEDERRKLRKEHVKLLKRLRKRRIRAKKLGKIIPLDAKLVKNQALKMRDLWLPQPKIGVRFACCRQTMGYVTSGDFSLTHSHGISLGYVTMAAVAVMSNKKCKDVVLVRDICTRQYRKAKLSICV